MPKKISVKIEEFTNREGQTKGKWLEVGVILSNDRGEYAILAPSVNLAGVLQRQNALNRKHGREVRDMVSASIFENDRQPAAAQRATPPPSDPSPAADDDIPF